jgi:hypothetical protein
MAITDGAARRQELIVIAKAQAQKAADLILGGLQPE